MAKKNDLEAIKREHLTLGTWLGRRQAFGMIASRCTAADAECLKVMRETGDYKKLGLSWEQFCKQHAGVSRAYADRLIQHLEEFGTNYFRLAELIQISGETYRLIAGSVSDDGIVAEGKTIPLTRERRTEVIAAVEGLRQKAKPHSETVSKRLKAIVAELEKLAPVGQERLAMIGFLDETARTISWVSRKLRAESALGTADLLVR